MLLAQRNHVVGALAADRADQPFGKAVLPRRPRRNRLVAWLREALGRSRGGFSTKIHLRTNAKGDPLTFDVTGGARGQRL